MQNNSKNSSLFNLLLLIIIFAMVFGWTKPTFDQAGAARAELSTLSEQKTALEKQVSDLQALKLEQENLSEVAKNVDLAAIPEQFSQDALINELSTLASRKGVSISSISFSVPVNSLEKVKKATVNVSLSADTGALVGFLKELENSSRKILVKTITVQLGRIEEAERVNFNLSMETYYINNQ